MKKKMVQIWKIDNDQQLTFSNHWDNILVQPNIDKSITSNIPIIISPLGLTYVSEKLITLKELDWLQQVCTQYSADQCMFTPEAIENLGQGVYST